MSDDPFVTHRSLLFTVAYEMLGSAADAEDVVQETWLRWAGVDQDDVREPRAYLVRIVTRLALDRLRTVARRREAYVGVWLPEPLLTSPDVAEDVELAENISIAMLTVLETLSPVERAVFVLREVFDVPYDEIAGTVDKSAFDRAKRLEHGEHRDRDVLGELDVLGDVGAGEQRLGQPHPHVRLASPRHRPQPVERQPGGDPDQVGARFAHFVLIDAVPPQPCLLHHVLGVGG